MDATVTDVQIAGGNIADGRSVITQQSQPRGQKPSLGRIKCNVDAWF